MSPQIQASCLIRFKFWQKSYSKAFFKTFGILKKFLDRSCTGKHKPNSEENEETSKMSEVKRGIFLCFLPLEGSVFYILT